ncbi:tRNA (N(6)-L-threonylcarbamoyladenosine(37)-C(2))-methylthiotransferase MtaB [uncultured Victivallis sp.]|uniref:tRNA (N(6)-L-threonylcarbamoyladenosine(37)-C(2))- methylthiotransferase MtaB n=1 Tax=uncultured Victivallis sp. TaxID=354118 RepID=UPI0025DCFEFF|nr:tRNA (N(6)-L-threonylcarbamoyladenosine(37)-C(2))-methylthiotransferase MtaB [uncultured Victivallis sp.]
MNRKAIVFTLGCRLNSADSALLVSRLTEAGYEVSESAENVALIIVNSCTVTAEAARKSRQMVRKFRSMHPEAVIVVTGCSAELDREAFLADSAADVVLTNPEKRSLPELVGEFLAGHAGLGGALKSMQQPVTPFRENAFGSFPFRSRAFLKIQEGCGNFCSYCIVPYARGPERSRAFDEVLADCRKAVEAGFPELVLTGVNICAYSDSGRDLGALVHEIARIDGEFRIRLSSTEPAPGNRSLLDVMSSEPKVCRFLHLALQNGSDRILAAMNRHYTTAEYADFVRAARERIPGIHLGSDLIVGFPGETEEDFAESCRFVESMEFANLHIFTYSPRAGTPAAALPGRIPPDVAKERHKRLEVIAAESKRRFIAGLYGQKLPVIFERIDSDGMARGWSDNYVELRVPADEVPLDRIVPVEATAENTASNLV